MLRTLILAALAAALLAAPVAAQGVPVDEPVGTSDEFPGAYVIATIGMGLGNGATILLNLNREGSLPWLSGGLGMLTGSMGLALGLTGLQESETQVMGALNIGLGSAALLLGARNLLFPHRDKPLQRTVSLAPGREAILTATPLATAEGAGVGISIRF